MKLIHNVPFQPHELEQYRQLVFSNLVLGMKSILDAAEEWEMEVSDENQVWVCF